MSSFYSDASLVMIPSGYKASKVYSAVPTDGAGDLVFTRALDTATRVGPDGLIEKVRTNLVLHSQDPTNAVWTKNAGATITSNTTIAPDGTLTADTLNVATTAFSGIFQAISSTSNAYTVSLFVKKGTKDFIYLFDLSAAGTAWFNLTNNTLGTITAGFTATITSVGDGWVRITMRRNQAVTPAFFQIGLSDADGVSTPASTGTAFIWGAQAELSDFGATPYIPTTTAAVSVGMLANVPRLDYLGGGCPKLLLEPQRTNLVFFSEQLNNAGWTASAVVTANTAVSPEGFTNADSVMESAANLYHILGDPVTTTSGTTYTFSFFAKPNGRNFARVLFGNATYVDFQSAYFNLLTGATSATASVTASMVSYGNGWYRCIATITSDASTTDAIYFGPARNMTDGYATYAGNVSLGIFAFGCQQEVGSYPTSYIPTLGAAVTRSKDNCINTSASALIGQTEGVVFVEFQINGMSLTEDVYSNNKNLTGSISLQVTTNGQLVGFICFAGTFIQFATSAGVIQVGQTYKAAIAYKTGDSALFLDGVQLITSSTAFAFTTTLTEIDIANNVVYFASQNNKNINQVLQFKTRLTNAQCIELTA